MKAAAGTMKKYYAFELFDTAEEAALRGVPVEVSVREQSECVWIKDDTLTYVVGYHMDCLRPVGSTRVISANVGGYKFCPYCGRALRVSDRITVVTNNQES